MIYLVTAVGFALLLGGGELLVRGAVDLAEWFRVPTVVIGMTVVAFGTSAPELLVAVNAAVDGATDVTLGNLVGANIANIFLILGVAVLIRPPQMPSLASRTDAIVLVIALGVLVALIFDGVVTRAEAAALIVLFVGYVVYAVLRRHFRGLPRTDEVVEHFDTERRSPLRPAALVVAGLVGLAVGGNYVVDGAVELARAIGVSQAVIGLTIVAIGTTLPELVASLVAGLRGQPAIAVGNIIGSNVFNGTVIVGIVGAIAPVPVPARILVIDIWAMALAGVMLAIYIIAARELTRVEGAVFVILYGVYLAMIAAGINSIASP